MNKIKEWDLKSSIVSISGISLGLLMIASSTMIKSDTVLGAGIGLVLGTIAVSIMSVFQIRSINKQLKL